MLPSFHPCCPSSLPPSLLPSLLLVTFCHLLVSFRVLFGSTPRPVGLLWCTFLCTGVVLLHFLANLIKRCLSEITFLSSFLICAGAPCLCTENAAPGERSDGGRLPFLCPCRAPGGFRWLLLGACCGPLGPQLGVLLQLCASLGLLW